MRTLLLGREVVVLWVLYYFCLGLCFVLLFFLRKRSPRKEDLNTGMSKPSSPTNNVCWISVPPFHYAQTYFFLLSCGKAWSCLGFVAANPTKKPIFNKNMFYMKKIRACSAGGLASAMWNIFSQKGTLVPLIQQYLTSLQVLWEHQSVSFISIFLLWEEEIDVKGKQGGASSTSIRGQLKVPFSKGVPTKLEVWNCSKGILPKVGEKHFGQDSFPWNM